MYFPHVIISCLVAHFFFNHTNLSDWIIKYSFIFRLVSFKVLFQKILLSFPKVFDALWIIIVAMKSFIMRRDDKLELP